MKKWIAIAIAVLFVAFVAFRAVTNYRAQRAMQNAAVQEKIIPVTTVQPGMKEILETIRASGNILASTEVTLYSKVSGKIQSNLVQMGSPVKPGQMVSLVMRDEIGYDYQPYEVKSDVKGIISKVLQNPGAAVNPNVPLMVLVDMDTVKAVAAVDELKIRFIRIGHAAKVFVQAFPGETHYGKVVSISPVCNPSSRTVDVEVRIPNLTLRLKPGMYAEAEFTQDRRKVMILPVSAVVEKTGGKVVFVPENGRVNQVSVTTGSMVEDRIEIVSGLKSSDTVVAIGASMLENGSRITVTETVQ